MLNDLRRREMVFKREESAFEGTAEYGFRHAILRDVVYDTIVPRQRREYHKQVADWLIEAGKDRLDEYNLLIAEHYERAEEKVLASEYTARAAQVAGIRGTLDESIKVASRALALLEGVDAPRPRMQLQLQLGQQYGFKGNFDAAIAQFESALAGARELGDRSAEAQILGELGRVVGTWQQKHEDGRKYLDEAMEIAVELDDNPNQMFLLRQLGNLGFQNGDFEEALDYLKQSLEVARKLKDDESVANALNSMGLTAWALEDFEQALEWLQEAMELSEKRADRTQMAMIIGNTSHTENELGNFDEAQRHAECCIKLAREVGSDPQLTGGLAALSNVLARQGDYEGARRPMSERLQLEVSLDDQGSQAFAVAEYGRLLALEGSPEKGLPYIGLAQVNPQAEKFGRSYFARLAEESRGDLSDDEVVVALERGANLYLKEVVDETLAELEVGAD